MVIMAKEFIEFPNVISICDVVRGASIGAVSFWVLRLSANLSRADEKAVVGSGDETARFRVYPDPFWGRKL